MDSSSIMAAGGAASMSPTSPASSRQGAGLVKRKRSTGFGIESSPGSINDDEHGEHEKKRQPGVKRACNECRQQKLRCDVVQDPFQSCSRCNRLNLECKIESNFKRVGKRSKHAEMEKEIERLRRNVARAQSQGFVPDEEEDQLQSPATHQSTPYTTHTRNPSLMGSDEAVSSLLHLKRGGSYNVPHYPYELGIVRLTDDDVSQLFTHFFSYYHPFLPFLNPQQAPEQFHTQHALLFWSIISVAARRFSPPSAPNLLTNLSTPLTRFLWTTIGEVPSNYYVVKAMCLLCAWPLPTSTTTSDPTHILCGVMMKTATGIGLHRPNHIQDFSRVSIELNREQLSDRVKTWAVCNLVAQNVGTGYGQPASSLYDWTLALRPGDDSSLQLTPELEARLQIERFSDKVSKEMYSNASDPRGVAGDEHRAMLMRVYRRDYAELQASILSQNLGPVVNLHLRAALLHMRLAGFFDSSSTPGYMDDLMGLWRAATSFLDDVLEINSSTSPSTESTGGMLLYATNYVQQMLVAGGFTILKLMKSFFSKTIDFPRGKRLFHKTVRAIRSTSVVNNDLQWRLAELMVQMWNGARLEFKDKENDPQDETQVQPDDSLQLKVRCRHSMSLVFDSVWRWREEYQAHGRGSLESELLGLYSSIPHIRKVRRLTSRAAAATKQPTHPDSANESSASSTQMDNPVIAPSLGAPASNSGNGSLFGTNGALTPGATGMSAAPPAGPTFGSINLGSEYDFFDPQNWMLDDLLNFNYSYVTPMEGA